MQFLSNLLGGGQSAQPAANAQATAIQNQKELIGAPGDQLFSDGTSKAGGTATTVAQAFSGNEKLIMIYFSMHNCPPCREFTPLLVELYNEINESQKQIEIVFFSGDQDQNLYNEYFGEQPWLALPFKDPRMKAAAKHFGVRGVPRLVVLNGKTGATVNDNAVQILIEQGPVIIEQWMEQV